MDLPASYASGDRRYPVVYALHGLFEGHAFWERRGLAGALQALRERRRGPGVPGGGGGRRELVLRERPAGALRRPGRDRPRRARRVDLAGGRPAARAGRSSGSRWAATRPCASASSDPSLFRAVATHSAMLLEAIPSAEQGAGRWHMAAFQAVFGDPIDAALWTSRTIPWPGPRRPMPKAAPALYFDCGSEDRYGLFAGNRDLDQRLDRARDRPHVRPASGRSRLCLRALRDRPQPALHRRSVPGRAPPPTAEGEAMMLCLALTDCSRRRSPGAGRAQAARDRHPVRRRRADRRPLPEHPVGSEHVRGHGEGGGRLLQQAGLALCAPRDEGRRHHGRERESRPATTRCSSTPTRRRTRA